MLDHILQCVQAFESEHGTSPDVVYINPSHYHGLHRYHAEIFESGQSLRLGFQLVILPGSLLIHPEAALLPGLGSNRHVA